ncbi:MAG: hypothetical protein ABGZ53_12465 [Fuerstiella sp.]
MTGQIYLLDADEQLVPMQEAPYDSEALLQRLLADHPSLLAGDQMNSTAPRRWLLIDREFGVPDEQESGNRWSLDHLFIDQDAIPTLVEVKRSSDTRLRREVVGQMMDYAANAVSYWSIEQIQARFDQRAQVGGASGGTELDDFLEDQETAAEFWQRVETNLQAGRIRMVFVADVIPKELKQIIEFLNGQMERAEVLGVEIKQYVNGDLKTLVPTVVGQSAMVQARRSSPSSGRQHVSKEEFVERCRQSADATCVTHLMRLIAWTEKKGFSHSYWEGSRDGSFIATFPSRIRAAYPFSFKHRGRMVFQMRFLKDIAPFDDPDVSQQLQTRLEQIPGFDLRGGMEGLPFIQIGSQQTDADMDSILSMLDWIAEQLDSVPAGTVAR